MRDQPTVLYHPSPNPEDQIPQLPQKISNLIIQAVNSIVAKAINQRLESDRRRSATAFDDPVSNNIQDISKKDQKPKENEFFDLDYKEPGLVVTINCDIYY